jgi:uncharacterized BrkB/YihY/UPF0761 family membrane protein
VKAATTIIASVVAASGMTTLNQALNADISVKPAIGGFIVGTTLLILAFFSVEIATALALMLLVSSILINATGILDKAGLA